MRFLSSDQNSQPLFLPQLMEAGATTETGASAASLAGKGRGRAHALAPIPHRLTAVRSALGRAKRRSPVGTIRAQVCPPPPPPPPPQSMFITLSGTMVISCLVNIVQGGGRDVLPRFAKIRQKRSSVSLILQSIVVLGGISVEVTITMLALRQICW